MTESLNRAYWYCITGSLNMGYVIKDEKVYIDVDSALALLNCYQQKLVHAGLMKISGLNPSGILELFDILEKDFHLLNFLGGTCEEDNLSQPSSLPSPQVDSSAVIPHKIPSQLKSEGEIKKKLIPLTKKQAQMIS